MAITCVAVGAAVVGGWRRQWIVVVGALFLLHIAVLALAFVSFRGVRHLIRAGRPHLAGPDQVYGTLTASLPSACCADDYLVVARTRSNRVMEATCLRTGSVQMRDVLAYAVTHGELTYGELEVMVEAYRDPGRRKSLLAMAERLDVPWLLSTARVVALQQGSVFDRLNAATMYELADWIDGSSLWRPAHCLTYLQLLCGLGQHARARALLDRANLRPEYRSYIAADLVNPFVGSDLGDSERWHTIVNEVLTGAGLDPVELADGTAASPFDRLRSKATSQVSDGPLVSVVMTTYRPDDGIDVAVRSILEQSWRNLELLIIDDGSPSDMQAALDKWDGVDPRIRIVREPRNRGTYPTRNLGLDLADGEFVTFQDSDDWSHPRRVEWQVERLLDSDLVATRSYCVRVSDRLEFNQVGYLPIRPNNSSQLFRKREVMDRVGYFDPVRKGADSEHHQRLLAAFGSRVAELDRAPLAFVLRRTDSLSRSDFSPGWHAPPRRTYRTAYEFWHRQVWSGEVDPYMPAEPSSRRFPVPREFRSIREVLPAGYDVVFASDWRACDGTQRAIVAQARALRARGYRVAVTQLESLRLMSIRMAEMSDPVQELINTGVVDQVSLEDDVRARMLLVESPSVLQYAPAAQVRMEVERIRVVVREAPYGGRAVGHRYDASRCVANLRGLLGADGLWIPCGTPVRRVLRSVLPRQLLSDEELPEVVDMAFWAADRTAFRGERAVVGWLPPVDRSAGRQPTRKPLAALDDQTIELRTMDAPTARDVTALREFLADVDFFVHAPGRSADDAPDRIIVEALASGAVVLVPRRYAEVFGDAAVYYSGRDVMRHVAHLYEQPESYRRQSALGREFVAARLSPSAYADAVAALLPPG